ESAQQMVDRRPSLASFSRISYLRELHGDTTGALTAMTQAAAAGSGSAADTAYVRTLIGDLHLNAGRLGDAEAQYRRTLADDPNYGMAQYGMARGADPSAVVTTARAALGERPTIYAEDAMGWALRQAGHPAEALPHARAAVRLDTADASLWYHLAVTEADLGLSAPAAADLARAF